MSIRVTDTEVKEIISTSINTTPFIITANNFVDNQVARSTAFAALNAATLKDIEMWIAAHLVYIRDPKLKEEKIGDATDTYNVPYPQGDGLKSTPYGLQAIMLDTTNILARQGKHVATIHCIYDDAND